MLTKVTEAPKHKSVRSGFTLVEVLISLAIAAIGFGVVLHSVGLQMSVVANSLNRHQMLLYASQVLEAKLASGEVEEDITDAEIRAFDRDSESDSSAAAGAGTVARYLYSLEARPVTADPRVQQVTTAVKGGRSSLRLSAYRIRVQRN